MADHMRTGLICDAITMAAGNVDLAAGAIFHSDRGTQYTSTRFAAHLKALGMTGSMGRTGVCWDNAMAESFFAALKNELVHRTVFPTRERARRAIAEYIEVFYNRQRLHSELGYKTPSKSASNTSKIAHWPRRTSTVTVRRTVTPSGESLATMLRPGKAVANTAADHITVTDRAVAQIPDAHRYGAPILVCADGARATKAWLAHLRDLREQHGLTCASPSGSP